MMAHFQCEPTNTLVEFFFCSSNGLWGTRPGKMGRKSLFSGVFLMLGCLPIE